MTWGNLQENRAAFYHAYGTAMAQWAGIENQFGHLFASLTKLPEALALDVFFSARSFLGRADMLMSTFPHVRDLPVAKTFLVDLVTKARTWQGVRNSLAHDGHNVIFQAGRGEPFHAISPHPGGTIEAHQLENAADNFFVLNQIALHCRGRTRPIREPELCAEALALLPADALVDGGGYRRAAPLLTRIQASSD